jgi:hypothetical protein
MNSTTFDSGRKSLNNHSSRKSPESIDVSAVNENTEAKAIQGPIRSSTFVLSESSVKEENTMPVSVPKRNTTFILSDSDGNTSQRRSLRFSPGQALEATSQKEGKKSIGDRITKTSWKLGNETSLEMKRAH